MDLIKNCKQVGKVRSRLKDLPETLDDTYDRILASIPEENWQIARTAMMLLSHSIRPLTLEELAEGMVVDYEAQNFEPEEHRLTNYRHVLEICSSLVSVSKNRHSPHQNLWLQQKNNIEHGVIWGHGVGKEVEVVQFAHFSVQEYMSLQRVKTEPHVARFRFKPASAHTAIIELSLVYLLKFSGGVRLQRIDFAAFPFLAYAAQCWPEHWRLQLSEPDQETVNELIRQLLDSEPDSCSNYINYINVCRPDAFIPEINQYRYNFSSQRAKSLDSIPQPLYYCAQLGHLQLCQWLIDDRGCDVNAVRGTFGQAIQIAARFGHRDVVALLLSKGAHVDRHCGEYGYPLQAAAFGGDVEIVKLLLDANADINAIGGKYGTALIAACDQQHVGVVNALLDRGADMEIMCIHTGKALNIAAGTGNKTLVNLLLSQGADINDTCGGEGTALYSAAEKLDLQMLKVRNTPYSNKQIIYLLTLESQMLIAAGADVNKQCSKAECDNALQVACSNPKSHGRMQQPEEETLAYIEIVRFLLKNGADPNLHGGKYGDALQAAVSGSARGNVEGNNIDVVKLILDHGGELNYRGGVFQSAMRATVYGGNIAAAHLLIDLGAELDDDIFLQAIENERTSVIPKLLERGVDVNAENKRGTALQFAIKNGDHATIRCVLSPSLIGSPTLTAARALVCSLLTLGSTSTPWAKKATGSQRYTLLSAKRMTSS